VDKIGYVPGENIIAKGMVDNKRSGLVLDMWGSELVFYFLRIERVWG